MCSVAAGFYSGNPETETYQRWVWLLGVQVEQIDSVALKVVTVAVEERIAAVAE